MVERITWAADDRLADLLRRYYQGEAEHWPAIQLQVHAELHARGIPIGPRHIRFRRTDAGYFVIAERADEHVAY